MSTLIWQGYVPNDNWQGAVDFLNHLSWNLSWQEVEGEWRLRGGDQLLFKGENKAEMESFLCGMAISLAVLPDKVLKQVRQIASE